MTPTAAENAATTTTPAWLWVVDDNADIRFSLKLLLDSDTLSVRTFAHAQELYEALHDDRPDCLLLDYDLPDTDGLGIQAHLQACGLVIPMVFLTAMADVPVAVAAMRHGAIDVIEKPGSETRLFAAITAALNANRAHQARRQAAERFGQAMRTLSPREREVLDAIGEGQRNKHVARHFDISPRTVETHRENAMRKMGVRNTAELIRVYTLVSSERGDSTRELL